MQRGYSGDYTFAWSPDLSDAISEPETLQLTIPAEAVLSNSAIPLATEVVITATAAILELGGSLVRPH